MSNLTQVTLKNRYFLRDYIAQGGTADVYQAWDNLRATRMAIKVLRRDLAQSAQFNRMFETEAELLRKLEHPNIVRLYEFDKDGDIVFIVMDWVEGTSLRQAIDDRKSPFNLDEISRILQPVCAALNYAHQNKVYHCDIKPANILLHVDGRVLLSDFGVARFAAEDRGGGTRPYMAPEQISGGVITPATDIYALGITVYEMLSGKVPFRGETQNAQGTTARERIAWEHINATPTPLRQLNPKVPASVENVVNTALNKEPRDRYATALSLRDAFEFARMEQGREDNVYLTTGREPYQPPSPVGRTVTPAPQPAPPPPAPAVPTTVTTVVPGMPTRGPFLIGRTGVFGGQFVPISKGELTIGRRADMLLSLPEASISRVHARLIRTRRGVYLQDDNSSVGTFVNGERLQPGIPVLLKSGDVIQLGRTQIFEFRG